MKTGSRATKDEPMRATGRRTLIQISSLVPLTLLLFWIIILFMEYSFSLKYRFSDTLEYYTSGHFSSTAATVILTIYCTSTTYYHFKTLGISL